LKELNVFDGGYFKGDWYLPTRYGARRITSIRPDYWVITGEGFARRSFPCTPFDYAYSSSFEADKAYKEEIDALYDFARSFIKKRKKK